MFSVPENHSTTSSTDARNTGRGGRPPKPAAERRTHRIGVNVNAAERAVIKARAAAAGLSAGVYLRQAGVGARLSSRINDRVYHQLSRIGVNVNQLARVANATGRLPERDTLEAILAQVLALRDEV